MPRLFVSALVLPLVLPVALRAQTPAPSHTLMPVPAAVEFREGRLSVDTGFTVELRGHRDPRLEGAVERAMARLVRRTGLILRLQPRRHEPAGRLVIEVAGPGEEVQSPGEDESYTIEVTRQQARLAAPTVVGAMRGLETLLQLVAGDGPGWFLPAVRIDDRPRFPWRGLLIDVARHWQPVEVIKRQLDGMAAVKLNVLHWHLSEDQGFRVESRRHPLLHGLGSDGLYYTQDQIREVVAYARDRGIRVVPEFDMPGHATSWFVGYPQYASAPGPYEIERRFGVFDPTFDPTREEVYDFLGEFVEEMVALFPDRYWHIGGDEVTGRHWRQNPRIQAWMRQRGLADAEALQAHFNQRLARILSRHERRMVGWDEILHGELPEGVVVQSWRGPGALARAAREGRQGILSWGYYLDHLRPAEFHYAVDPLPADTVLTAEETSRVLGGEACMWAEHIWSETIDSRIWPRMAAVAERLWSPREVQDVDDMYRRLGVTSVRLEDLGLTHESHTDRMLRRLAGGRDIEPLRTLLAAASPVFFWERGRLQRPTQATPLTRVVDAARPDAALRRPLVRMARALVLDAPGHQAHRAELEALFQSWPAAAAALDSMARREPLVADALPAAALLARLGRTGLQAMEYLAGGTTAPPGWAAEARALLTEAENPAGLLRVEAGPGIGVLVEAAARPPN